MIESAYYIAKNASTLHACQAELWLLPMHFQIKDAIAYALPTRLSLSFMRFPTCYCRNNTYQEGVSIQKYNTNAIKTLRKRSSACYNITSWLLYFRIFPASYHWETQPFVI